MGLRLLRAGEDHVLRMMAWFPDRESCQVWGGRDFRFPFTAQSFLADVRLAELPSYAMMKASDLYGFGQYYLRSGRCHLARLAVAPMHRGGGCGTWMIQHLMRLGTKELQVKECSLYVNTGNTAALALYERLGFERASHPEVNAESSSSYFMVNAEKVSSRT